MKRVVIIGGGFAGSTVAMKLQSDFNVTLIDDKDYFEYTPGVLRAIVEPAHANKLQAIHDGYLKKAKVLNCKVDSISANNVVCGDKKIGYDYLVIASGSSYTLPIKEQGTVVATRAKHLAAAHTDLEAAKRILIIGGGLVGVELAAEIATHYNCRKKEKELILVQSPDTLIPRNKEKSQEYSKKFLEKKGVELMFGERVSEGKKGVYKTKSGKKIEADLCFVCTGIRTNSSFINGQLKKAVGERGHVNVNEHFQVVGQDNIFAIGDVTGIREEKTAQNAELHAETCVNNIEALEKKEPMVPYKAQKRALVISLGKWNAIYEGKDFVFTGILPALLKGGIERWILGKYR
tara:strand:+ start:9065 stop:10108 length:1044 start_codon:yes stop_codon:yes gene_type:complete